MRDTLAMLTLALLPSVAWAQPEAPMTAELLAESTAVQPGQPLTVGVLITAEKGWHTYWVNPGDSGLATRIDWQLPQGWKAGPIDWPYPHYFEAGGIAGFGYEEQVLLPVTLTPPDAVDGSSVTLTAQVTALVCREACIPANKTVQLTLPVAEQTPAADARHAALFAAARAAQPQPLDAERVAATREGERIVLRVAGLDSGKARYYSISESEIDAGAPQDAEATDDGLRLTLKPSPYANQPLDKLVGVLVVGEAAHEQAYRIETEVLP